MAIRMGDGDLVSRLMVGDLGANSIFYHKSCYTNLHKYVKICKETKTTEIRTEQLKEATYGKVIAFIHEVRGACQTGIELQELEKMYLEYLYQYDIHIESHVTRFGENLIKKAPCLEIRKVSKKLHAFASNSVDDMQDEYIKSSTDCIKQLRNIIQPIRLGIFSMKNSFSGTLKENVQVETVSPQLLNLTSMLMVR